MKPILLFLFLLSKVVQVFAQYTVDTIPFYGYVKIRTLDEKGEILLVCEYDSASWILMRETIYDRNGREQRSVYFGPKDMRIIRQTNPFTGLTEAAELNVNGFLTTWYEETNDTFETRYQSYFPNGRIAEKGQQARVPVFSIDLMDTVRVYGEKKNERYRAISPVGEWHYYYENGNDSAVGNYANEVYIFYEPISSCEGPFIMIGIVTSSGIQNGTWYYYSADGKLLFTEEWDMGNLLNRKENP